MSPGAAHTAPETGRIRSAAKQRQQTGTAVHLQAPQVGVGNLAQLGDGTTLGGHRTSRTDQRRPCREEGARPTEPAGEERRDDFDEGDDDELRDDADEVDRAVRAEHGAQPVPLIASLDVELWMPLVEIADVANARLGHDDDAPAGDMRAPAQIAIFTGEVDVGIEPADGAEQVGAHEHACRRQDEHVAHRVVLLLVEIAAVAQRIQLAELVGDEPGALQPLRVIPLDELRAGDGGIGTDRLIDEQSHGITIERDVVV